jgi:glycosyltransferase involved in cell wall biosynthesis
MEHNELEAVSIVVPAYNEAASIKESVERMISVLDTTGREFEIVVVSDGSSDNTEVIVSAIEDTRVKLLRNKTNRGKGFSLRHGFSSSNNPLVVFIDGDLDLNPSVLPDYLTRLDNHEADVIIGSKMHPDSKIDYPMSRRVASKVFKIATRAVTGLQISDTQTGLKAMRKEKVSQAVESCETDGFSFDLEFLSNVVDSGGSIKDAPVILDFDFTSTIGTSSALTALWDLRYASRYRRWKKRKQWRKDRAVSHDK